MWVKDGPAGWSNLQESFYHFISFLLAEGPDNRFYDVEGLDPEGETGHSMNETNEEPNDLVATVDPSYASTGWPAVRLVMTERETTSKMNQHRNHKKYIILSVMEVNAVNGIRRRGESKEPIHGERRQTQEIDIRILYDNSLNNFW